MNRRLYSISFFALTGVGIWFQQSYMQVYSEEFEIQMNADRSHSEVFRMTDFKVRQYHSNHRESALEAQNGVYLNNGKIAIGGGIQFESFDKVGALHTTMFTGKAIGTVLVSGDRNSLLDNDRRLQSLVFPDEVVIKYDKDIVTTRNLRYLPASETFETTESVALAGPNRKAQGKGLKYIVKGGKLAVGGPIKGVAIPEPHKNSVSKTDKAREESQ